MKIREFLKLYVCCIYIVLIDVRLCLFFSLKNYKCYKVLNYGF